MRMLNKIYAGVVAAGIGFTTAAAFADDIRVGITMRMVSENGQAYGQMMMDEIKGINEAGGIHGKVIKATLMNDECKSDKVWRMQTKWCSRKGSSLDWLKLLFGDTSHCGCDSQSWCAAIGSSLY